MPGDQPVAFEPFCQAEFPRLVGVLAPRCGSVGVAEELAQEALVRAYERWPTVERHPSPRAWVHRVALNLANSWFRRRAAEHRANARHGEHRAHHDPPAATTVAIRDAVAQLPERQQTVLALRYFCDLSVAEAAEAMGCSEGAVAQHTRRAVAALRPRFASDGSSYTETLEVRDGGHTYG